MDSNPHEVAFYNLDGRSYSHVFQVEASYPFFKGFTLTGAYRLTDAQTTYKGQRMEKPLTSKYKGLLTASYQTPLGIWQFDATLQLNGGGRMPAPYELADGQLSWERPLRQLRATECSGYPLFPPLVCLRRRGEPDKLQTEESDHRRRKPVGRKLRLNDDMGTCARGKSLYRNTFQPGKK